MNNLEKLLEEQTNQILELQDKIEKRKNDALELVHEKMDEVFYNFENFQSVDYRVNTSMQNCAIFVTAINGKKTLINLSSDRLKDAEDRISSFLIDANIKFYELMVTAEAAKEILLTLSKFKIIDKNTIHRYKREDYQL